MAQTLEIGQLVYVRSRRHLVENIVPKPTPTDFTVVDLACVEDDSQGETLRVLWENELDAKILGADDWSAVAKRGFDSKELFSAYFNTLRWNCVTATDPNLFQAPFRAGIQIHPYQLEPLRKALQLPRVNLFIADDVGLGKTIEAGLIARELLLRRRVDYIVVAAPPSVLLQWKEELASRFGLSFEVLDRDYVARVRRERGFSVNPWGTHSRFLVSTRLLIDDGYLGPLEHYLGPMRPGALLILDEAHHAAPSSGAKYAIDSQMTKMVRKLSKRFEHKLFLSATPHNGHSNSFSALLEILDEHRFTRGFPIDGRNQTRDILIRRMKEDLRKVEGGLPERMIEQVTIEFAEDKAPELALARMLSEYRAARAARLSDASKRSRAAAGLLVVGLQQRLLSSVEAFARTLKRHRQTIERQAKESGSIEQDSPITMALFKGSAGPDDEVSGRDENAALEEHDRQIDLATAADSIGKVSTRERQLLDDMNTLAEKLRYRPDAKVVELIRWIKASLCQGVAVPGESEPVEGAKWNDRRVIIFTEWDDTKRYLVQQISAAIDGTDQSEDRIRVFHGPTPEDVREEIKLAFNADPKLNPIRILVATDAAREGLNLQTRCYDLFHFDIPWNPSRLEQRNGRIDRKLQPSDKVYCRYFYYENRPEDRVLEVLVRKTNLIRAQLGSQGRVIDRSLERVFAAGIDRERVNEQNNELEKLGIAEDAAKAMEQELEGARDRQEEIRESSLRLKRLLEQSRQWLAYDSNLFEAAFKSAMKMAGAENLVDAGEATGLAGPVRLYRLPEGGRAADSHWSSA